MNEQKPLALIIEDEPEAGEIFLAALNTAGYIPELVTDGTEAVEWLSTKIPQLIVLDLHLPGLSGTEVLAYIQRDGRLTETAVFVTSADTHMSDTLRHEVDIVLDKPVGFRHLRDAALKIKAT